MSKPDLPLDLMPRRGAPHDRPPRRPWNPWILVVAWGLAGGLFVGTVLIVWTEVVVAGLPPDVEYHDPDQGRLLRREAARAWYLEQEQARRDKASAAPAK